MGPTGVGLGLGEQGMKRFCLWIAHHGKPYRGFQSQSFRQALPTRAGSPRLWPPQGTVQEELETKLAHLLGRPVTVWGAGRTDRGVHATCQVVAFDIAEPNWTCQSLLKALNAILHPSLRGLKCIEVGAEFHPRFSALRRTYHYYLWAEASGSSPFFDDLCYLIPEFLDLDAMRQAAQPLVGSHDFRAYTHRPEPGQTVRHLEAIRIHAFSLQPQLTQGLWGPLSNLVTIEVVGNAFLRRMVRQLVANLLEVGRGRWPVERPAEILQSLDPSLGAPPAPAQGLYLVDVEYPEGAWT